MNDKIVVTEKDSGNVLEILGKDGILRIAVWLGERKSNVKVYELFCPVCEEGINHEVRKLLFKTTRKAIKRGTIPCGCSMSRDKVLKSYGVDEFIGYKTNTPKGGVIEVKSCIYLKGTRDDYKVYCSYCKDSFITKKDALVSGNIPCNCSKRVYNKLKSQGLDDLLGKSIPTPRGGILKPITLEGYVYKCQCSICSLDKELNPEPFKIKRQNLRFNKFPCQCSTAPKYTKPQKEVLITRACETYNLEFLGFTEKGKLKLKCKNGHITESKSFNNFMHKSQECPKCVKNGYSRTVNGNFYLVRWYGFGESFLKFGITNRPHEERCRQQARQSKLNYETVASFEGNGDVVYECEKIIKVSLNTHICPKDWLPDGHTETVKDTPENLEKILKIVEECGLK